MDDGGLGWRVFCVLSGPVLGTYVATLAVAWPRPPRPLIGRSICGGCGSGVPAYRQIPMISFAMASGRRSCCAGRIPLAYPIGEAYGLAVGLAAAVRHDGPDALLALTVGLSFVYTALVDFRRFSIPLAGLALLGAGLIVDFARIGSAPEALARAATGAVAAIIFEGLRRLPPRRPEGRGAALGGGDVILAGVISAWVGWRAAPLVIAGAALAPLLVQALTRKSGPVPFGLWLCLVGGAVVIAV